MEVAQAGIADVSVNYHVHLLGKKASGRISANKNYKDRKQVNQCTTSQSTKGILRGRCEEDFILG